VNNEGFYDTTIKRFRTRNNGSLRGVADLLGIWKSKPLAIEVKTKTGELSEYQILFLKRFKEKGGIAIKATSLEDLQTQLLQYDSQLV
jgi:hypothetical protein